MSGEGGETMKPYDYENDHSFGEEDPYERGFADKLYEDCEEPVYTDDPQYDYMQETPQPPLQPRPSAAELCRHSLRASS